MHLMEIAVERRERERKLYIRLFWVFMLAAVACFVLTTVLEFDYAMYGWLSLTAAIICESRQQAAKGWLAGVSMMAAAIRSGSMFSEDEDLSQVVQDNGATEEMNWRAHA